MSEGSAGGTISPMPKTRHEHHASPISGRSPLYPPPPPSRPPTPPPPAWSTAPRHRFVPGSVSCAEGLSAALNFCVPRLSSRVPGDGRQGQGDHDSYKVPSLLRFSKFNARRGAMPQRLLFGSYPAGLRPRVLYKHPRGRKPEADVFNLESPSSHTLAALAAPELPVA